MSEAKDKSPMISATKVDARTTSKVVTPNNLNLTSMSKKKKKRAEEPWCTLFGIENAMLFEHFGDYGHGGVYRIGDDEDKGIWSYGSNPRGKISHDARVDLSWRLDSKV